MIVGNVHVHIPRHKRASTESRCARRHVIDSPPSYGGTNSMLHLNDIHSSYVHLQHSHSQYPATDRSSACFTAMEYYM